MKLIIISAILIISTHFSSEDQCTAQGSIDIAPWTDLETICHDSISNQIQQELTASITYLTMSAHFSGDVHYRPGVAKFFLASAVEEREHAKKLMDYLLMRGGKIQRSAIKNINPEIKTWKSVKDALQSALILEKSVTENIKKIVGICEGVQGDKHGVNDYHAVDYLTGDFLQEQYQGMRQISGHLATMSRMHEQFGNLAEVIFDKTFP